MEPHTTLQHSSKLLAIWIYFIRIYPRFLYQHLSKVQHCIRARSPKREFNLRSHFTFILFWRNLTLVNMLDTSELHFSGKPTTGSWSNFRLQKWKMAENKYDYKIHSILFTVLYCFLFFCIYNCSFLRYRVEQQHFEKCTIFWRHKYKII